MMFLPRAGILLAVGFLFCMSGAQLHGAQTSEKGTTMTQQAAARVEKIADNLVFPEGPVWHPDGFLLFSDVHGKTIERIKPEGGSQTWFDKGKKTNGLIMSNDGRSIYACCHSEFEMLRIDAKTGDFEVLTSKYEGKPYLNVNDVALDKRGNVFFTDPTWAPGPDKVQGVYRISPDGKVVRAVTTTDQPNGLVVSPDQKWLYLARSGTHDIMRFKLEENGDLTEGSVWLQLDHGDNPDGMTIDSKGNLYIAQYVTGNIRVVSPSGKTLMTVPITDRTTNCELQPGTNEKVLWVTCGGSGDGKRDGSVWRVTFPDGAF